MPDSRTTSFFGRKLTVSQKLIRLSIPLLIAIAALGAFQQGWLGNGSSAVGETEAEQGPAVRLMPVNVATIQIVDSFEQSRNYSGVIKARRRSELAFEQQGRIVQVNVDEGQDVVEGQVLATLDTRTLDSQLVATNARLGQAKAQLDEINAGPRKEAIMRARAMVTAARSDFDNAQLNLSRRRKLIKSRAVSSEELDQARFAEKSARANLDAVEQQLAELEAGSRSEQVEAGKAAVAQFEASVSEIKIAIQKTQLLAPYAGTVTRRYLDPGSFAAPGTPVVKLVEQQSLEAWIGLPIDAGARLKVGDEVQVFVEQSPYEATCAAKISELDMATRTQTVIFALHPTASSTVVTGQICQISLSRTIQRDGAWVPTSALAKGIRGLWSIMVIRDEQSESKAVKQDVEVVYSEENRAFIRGALKGGEQVVVDGVHRIVNGQNVLVNSKPVEIE